MPQRMSRRATQQGTRHPSPRKRTVQRNAGITQQQRAALTHRCSPRRSAAVRARSAVRCAQVQELRQLAQQREALIDSLQARHWPGESAASARSLDSPDAGRHGRGCHRFGIRYGVFVCERFCSCFAMECALHRPSGRRSSRPSRPRLRARTCSWRCCASSAGSTCRRVCLRSALPAAGTHRTRTRSRTRTGAHRQACTHARTHAHAHACARARTCTPTRAHAQPRRTHASTHTRKRAHSHTRARTDARRHSTHALTRAQTCVCRLAGVRAIARTP